ncbi:hypothetical protein ANN_14694 [Periplaneta americana]|uniref:Uncharacterized protein n=1 Tax=Periplaneta americana TaxID=6978 RepID=A0ABQ8SXM2_PERAM|nr:hypothetical protein ANN_14694 [Periplaneta americana]
MATMRRMSVVPEQCILDIYTALDGTVRKPVSHAENRQICFGSKTLLMIGDDDNHYCNHHYRLCCEQL